MNPGGINGTKPPPTTNRPPHGTLNPVRDILGSTYYVLDFKTFIIIGWRQTGGNTFAYGGTGG